MTTIAWDGATLAGDTQASDESGIIYVPTKLRRLSDGRLLGAAGLAGSCRAMLDWIEGGCKGARPKTQDDEDDSATVLEIHPDGSVFRHERVGSFQLKSGPAAVGSGAPFAMAAMLLGKTAVEAVRVAMELDPDTGGEITTLKLEPVCRGKTTRRRS